MIRIIYISILCCLIGVLPAVAQRQQYVQEEESPHASLYEIPPQLLIDCPTAGTLPRGNYNLSARIYDNGGAIWSTDIGFTNRLQLGISYGGEKIFSNQKPSWNPRVEFSIKFHAIDEMGYVPAFSLGFTSQGYGRWSDEFDRYAFKSRGFYVVMSRSFYFYNWTSSWHAGANYSLEDDVDQDDDPNVFFGFDATFKHDLALLIEYDAALNDNRSSLPDGSPYPFAGEGRGYLNASVKWLFRDHLELELLIKDLFNNRRSPPDVDNTVIRELRLTFTDSF